ARLGRVAVSTRCQLPAASIDHLARPMVPSGWIVSGTCRGSGPAGRRSAPRWGWMVFWVERAMSVLLLLTRGIGDREDRQAAREAGAEARPDARHLIVAEACGVEPSCEAVAIRRCDGSGGAAEELRVGRLR